MRHIAALVIACVLSGCAGGGVNTTPRTSDRTASVSIRVPIAQRTSSADRRRPMWVSPNTQSIVITAAAASNWFTSQATFQPFYSTTINLSSCQVADGTATCTVTFPVPVYTPVGGAAGGGFGVKVDTYDGLNGTGNMLSASSSFNSYDQGYTECSPPQGGDQIMSCAIALGGVVNTVTYSQSHALVAGTPETVTLNPVFLDPSGAQITDTVTSSGAISTCLLSPSYYPLYVSLNGASYSDPHVSVPYQPADPTGCDGAFGAYNSANGSNINSWQFTFDGTYEAAPAPLSLILGTAQQAPNPPPPSGATWGQVGLLFTPIIVPASSTAFASTSSPSQSVTITPASTYSGAVSLSIDQCLLASVTLNGTEVFTVTNVASSPLVSAAPSSQTSTNGSAVTFSLTPVSGSATGACTYHASNDPSTEYGVTIGM